MEGVIVVAIIFGALFGVIYLFVTARHKERLSLIEKGADASIFYSTHKRKTAPIWKILVLNISLLLMGIGIGIFVAGILHKNFNVEFQVAFPGTIFTLAGVGLFIGFYLSKKLD
ncbi:hypothetical protein HX109_02280 [Galbibacter sp. BG1]|uniref:DUF6249 domain-containing protein n=1 Tax=Galbibacter sp. BG1 TaxID=1170699 RepID=UPI0015BE2499|nr:DUF6249 domain-containing protein [Galbibacter sp. BG1]QLE00442.1 hypothetical protein HX109_02280 [Galbibacter sp. BG1]